MQFVLIFKKNYFLIRIIYLMSGFVNDETVKDFGMNLQLSLTKTYENNKNFLIHALKSYS